MFSWVCHIFAFIWVWMSVSPFRFRFLRALLISSCVISTIIQYGRRFYFLFRGGVELLHCAWGDQPFGEAFRVRPKFFHCHSRSHVCRAVEVSQAAILNLFYDESHSFVMPRDVQFLYFDVCAAAKDMSYRVSIFALGAMCVSCNSVTSILVQYINWGLSGIVGLVPDKMLILDQEPLYQTTNVTRQVIMLGG
jgi:hypothetical protein